MPQPIPMLQTSSDDRAPVSGNADYDALPVAIRCALPVKNWLWLSDREKAHLEQTETEPDW